MDTLQCIPEIIGCAIITYCHSFPCCRCGVGASGELLEDIHSSRLPNCPQEGDHCELNSCKGIEVMSLPIIVYIAYSFSINLWGDVNRLIGS